MNSRSVVLAAVLVACGKDKEGEPVDPCAEETSWETIVGADEAELQRDDLGTQQLDSMGYVEIDVVVPEGALSTAASCGNYGDGGLGTVWTLTDPSGNVVYTGDDPDAGGFRSDYVDDRAVAILPISRDLPLTAGTWKVKYYVEPQGGGGLDCEAVHRIDEPSGSVFVNLVFVGPEGLDACTASTDEGFQAALAVFEDEWGSAGLTPVYNYVDFPGDKAKYSVIEVSDDDAGEFNDLLRTVDAAGPRSVTFFFVEEITNLSSGGLTILGLSAGPPGMPATNGTSKSGIVVSAVDFDSAPEDIGKIMSHEGGHFLGLYHTTEKDGSRNDLLGDTPECEASADTSGDGLLSPSECAGKGGDNVMFWTLTAPGATMSGDQGWVVQRNPAVD